MTLKPLCNSHQRFNSQELLLVIEASSKGHIDLFFKAMFPRRAALLMGGVLYDFICLGNTRCFGVASELISIFDVLKSGRSGFPEGRGHSVHPGRHICKCLTCCHELFHSISLFLGTMRLGLRTSDVASF